MLRPILALLLAVPLVATIPVGAQDWPNWRGPHHDGISSEKGFEAKWEQPPPKIWEREIGSGFSGLSCVANRVYTCGTADGQQTVLCLDADTGNIVWKTPIEKEFRDRQGGDGPRATPTVSDGRVYVIGAQGKLVSLDVAEGHEVWSRQFDNPPKWGYSGSVFVDGELAIVPVGGDGALRAVNKLTGKDVWQCGKGVVGYSTPYPFDFEGKRYVVGFLGKEALLAELATGALAGRLEWETSYDVNAATPIFHDGRLLLSSGYDHGSILLRLARDGDQLKTDKIWENKSIRAKFQSPVLCEGYLYVSDEVGLRCVEFATGTEKWSERGITHGTLVIADGYLVLLTEKGELQIAKATPKAFEPLTSVKLLEGRHWTVPTLYKGRLYVRNLKQAVCFRLAK
jgi:outer membrane protein assembly factor BamB